MCFLMEEIIVISLKLKTVHHLVNFGVLNGKIIPGVGLHRLLLFLGKNSAAILTKHVIKKITERQKLGSLITIYNY